MTLTIPTRFPPPIRIAHVIIPARNEATLLPRCLASVATARQRAELDHPTVHIEITVVLDRCTDASAEVARTHEIRTLTADFGSVGAVRHAGACAALATTSAAGLEAGSVWLASTDADSVVPAHWLTGHLDLAARYDAVIGTVEPLGLTDTVVLQQWRTRHQLAEGHPHIHGANLGVRGSTYLRVGGFRPLSTGEDVDLVARVRGLSPAWIATDTVRVATSARAISRCHGGFSDYLAALATEVG